MRNKRNTANATAKPVDMPADEVQYTEVLEMRTANTKHYRCSNGKMKAVISSSPIHVLDKATGKYTEAETTLSDNGNYFENRRIGLTAKLNKRTHGKLIELEKDGYCVSMQLLDCNCGGDCACRQDQNASGVVYENILPDTDLSYTLMPGRVKEEIVVKRQKESYRYAFALKTGGLTATLNEAGKSISLAGSDGKEVFCIPAPHMRDSAGAFSDAADYSLTAAGRDMAGTNPNEEPNYILTVTADSAWINAEERMLPVVIDPTITCYATSGSFLDLRTYTSQGILVSTLGAGVDTAGTDYALLGRVNMTALLSAHGIAKLTDCKLHLKPLTTNGSNYSVYSFNKTHLYDSVRTKDGYEISLWDMYDKRDKNGNIIDEDGKIIDYADFMLRIADAFDYFGYYDHIFEIEHKPPMSMKNVSYGQHNLQKMDILLPANVDFPIPAVVTIHGGSWSDGNSNGNKEYYTDETKYKAMSDFILEQGCAHVSINYRLLGNGAIYDNTPPYVKMLDDIKNALICLAKNYSDYISTTKCALMGYSAGGHLALLYAYTRANKSIPVKLVVSEAGPTDLSVSMPANQLKPVYDLVGIAENDTDELKTASPIKYADTDSPKTILAYGTGFPTPTDNITSDGLVPISQATELIKKLDSAKYELFQINKLNHEEFKNLTRNYAPDYFFRVRSRI